MTLNEVLAAPLRRVTPVYGGDINDAYKLTLADGRQVFMKANRSAGLSFFQAEADGLEAIRATGAISVPKVLAVGRDQQYGAFLLLEALVQYLMDRGAVNAFDANTADFSRMADYPWFISDILQKARIKTDEEGLVAAAVTMVMMAGGALMEPEEPQYKEFHANEPFRYDIVATQTRTPLAVFAGQEVRQEIL